MPLNKEIKPKYFLSFHNLDYTFLISWFLGMLFDGHKKIWGFKNFNKINFAEFIKEK